ncbi:hypothetical protein FNV43_RR20204 [Rhamnella rubrinervis]|uniref:RNase H type-1 domain-containing protein n=1 Tax=Rhamnella rubrinervis TaxID=2594499 RepID=A0A8K0DVH9_9ROSA|nr:hypothetical protein FNV43_RR20204 [Rhamnella rubrinervis]
MALVWALKISEGKHWSNIIWSADSQEMVKEINAMEDPSQWDTRYLMISCRRTLSSRHWKLNWNARSSNSLADSIAKWTLRRYERLLLLAGQPESRPRISNSIRTHESVARLNSSSSASLQLLNFNRKRKKL